MLVLSNGSLPSSSMAMHKTQSAFTIFHRIYNSIINSSMVMVHWLYELGMWTRKFHLYHTTTLLLIIYYLHSLQRLVRHRKFRLCKWNCISDKYFSSSNKTWFSRCSWGNFILGMFMMFLILCTISFPRRFTLPRVNWVSNIKNAALKYQRVCLSSGGVPHSAVLHCLMPFSIVTKWTYGLKWRLVCRVYTTIDSFHVIKNCMQL